MSLADRSELMKRWLISSRSFRGRMENSEDHGSFQVNYSGDLVKTGKENETGIAIDGFVLPRDFCYEKYRRFKGEELVRRLYDEKGLKFIDHLKGIFTILIVEADRFYVFNDRHSIRKFFIYRKDDEFLIASDLSLIAEAVELDVDADRAAIFCLMSRFIGGMTLFRNVNFSGPATALRYDGSLDCGHYWLPDQMLDLEAKKTTIPELASFWKKNIQRYLDCLQPAGITMTLTGGKDSRMILAALLSLGIKPSAFTFGDPACLDARVAGKVAAGQGLNYHVYFVEKPSAGWFATQGKRIVALGDSLLNIHRAHRLDAIEREMENNPANEMIFVGDMGGEYIHGFSYNDYILSKLIRLWRPGASVFNIGMMQTILAERHFKVEAANLENVCSLLESQPFIRNKDRYGNFHVEFYIDDALHHTQDMNLYLKKMRYLVCPFMDIDFMEALFSSPYHMPLGDGEPVKNHVLEMWQPDLRLGITHLLAPELSGIAYGKRGHYTAHEFYGSKLLLLLKRTWRWLFDRNRVPTFPYRHWMAEFVAHSIDRLSPQTALLFDGERCQDALSRGVHGTTEGDWQDFSAAINIDFIIKEFMKTNEKV